MKKISFLSLAVIFLAASANAASGKKVINSSASKTAIVKTWEPSAFTEAAFRDDFGNVPVIAWEPNGLFSNAVFLQHGALVTAHYDRSNNLVGTTTVKKFRDLPAKARQKIHEKYSDYTVNQVIYFDANEDNNTSLLLYNLPQDEDNYFVELAKTGKRIVVEVSLAGEVSYFTEMK